MIRDKRVRHILKEKFSHKRSDSKKILSESAENIEKIFSERAEKEENISLDFSEVDTVKFLKDVNTLAESIFSTESISKRYIANYEKWFSQYLFK
jgi:hypothetical protein